MNGQVLDVILKPTMDDGSIVADRISISVATQGAHAYLTKN